MLWTLQLRCGFLFCHRICLHKSSRDLCRWSWRNVAAQHQKYTVGYSNLKSLSKITLMFCGIKYVTTTTQCERLYQREEPPKMMLNSGLSLGQKNSQDTLLKKISFIINLGVRSCILFLKFGPLLLAYPFTFLSASMNSLWLNLLLKATESSGPVCIKLGQWASTRQDLFSKEFCVKFSKLHVKVTPHPWGYTELCLKRAFGDDYGHVLKFYSMEPIGSGCVAQVYKAYTDLSIIQDMESQTLVENTEHDSAFEAWEVQGLTGIFGYFRQRKKPDNVSLKGQYNIGIQQEVLQSLSLPKASEEDLPHLIPVAVKVLHPGLSQQVKMDLLLIKTWSRILGLIPGFRWLSLTEIVEEFEKLMTRQIDLRFEARNLERFQQKFQKMEFIKFPTPLRPFVTKNILVETFEDGEPLSMYLQESVSSQIKQRIAAMGVNMLMKMVFVDNFVHADLHPGNILVQGAQQFTSKQMDQTTLVDMCDTLIVNVGPSRCPLRLVLLDTGIVAELQEKDLENFRSVFTAVLLGQGETVAELILHHARANQCTDVESFKSRMAELVKEARENTVSLGKLQIAVLLSRVFGLLMKHKVKLESNFASIVFAILVLEGLGRSLDPEIDILEAARPLLLQNASSLV
ncbi:putative aarF domain-containing protein kinase 2 [Mixophyes fleayi]|uniref:putative aarF domain-containing protein kinase 2 n=1 Tax=Mixophyes fleayi TaxID=3061075 RepID=UPI003F4E3BA0